MPYRPPPLGAGLVYGSVLEPVLEEAAGLLGMIEVEPQTLWAPRASSGPTTYRTDGDTLERLGGYGLPVVLHGVGNPVGGTLPPDPVQARLFAEAAEAVDAPWVSEHLSFNRARQGGEDVFAGFMLPPVPTPAGVETAAASVRALAHRAGRPLAVETGVNYLRRRPGELTEGEFVGAVARRAGCGILLDLHNLWVNERNGRQRIVDFLADIPLDRVWEIHLAGGSERGGLLLDSHSGGVPDPLLQLTRSVLPDLPALGAVVFELLPANLASLGLDGVRAQLETLAELWEGRDRVASAWAPAPELADPPLREGRASWPAVDRQAGAPAPPEPPEPPEWESALVRAVLGRPAASPLERELAGEPGVAVVGELIGEFRAAMVTRNLKLTSRLLLLSIGPAAFRRLLEGHGAAAPPEPFAASEAEAFGAFLASRDLDVPYLADVLAFERATLATLLDGRCRVVPFAHEPVPLLRALAAGRLPERCAMGAFEVEVTGEEAGEGWSLEDAAGSGTWHH